MSNQISTHPSGTEYPLPQPSDYDREFERVKTLVD